MIDDLKPVRWEAINSAGAYAVMSPDDRMLAITREEDGGEIAARIVAQEERVEALTALVVELREELEAHGWTVASGWHSRMCPQSLPPAAAPCTCGTARSAIEKARGA